MNELDEGLLKLGIAYARVRIAYKDFKDARKRHVSLPNEMAYLKRLRVHTVNLIDRLADVNAWRDWAAKQTRING